MKLKFLIPLFIFITLITFFYYALKQDPNQLPSALVGQPVPAFKASNLLKENEIVSDKVFLGNVSLLHVWASWCEACQKEHDFFNKIAGQNITKLKVYGLNYKDTDQTARRWLEALGNPYEKVIQDPKGEIALNIGVYGTPETFLIDSNGIIRYRHVGPLTQEIWEETIFPKINKMILEMP